MKRAVAAASLKRHSAILLASFAGVGGTYETRRQSEPLEGAGFLLARLKTIEAPVIMGKTRRGKAKGKAARKTASTGPDPDGITRSAPTLFNLFDESHLVAPRPDPFDDQHELSWKGPEDDWTPSPKGTWFESTIWNETDVFQAELSTSPADDDDDEKKLQKWTMKVGKGGQLYSVGITGHGELFPPQAGDDSPWTDDCFVTTIYDGKMMDGDPKLNELGMNFLQNGYYIKPHMDEILQKPFYEPVMQEHYNAEETSYSITNLRFTSQPSVHRSDVMMYTKFRTLGNGVMEINWYFYNFGKRPQDALTFPWGGVRPSKMPCSLVGKKGGGYETNGKMNKTESYRLHESGGWLGISADSEDTTSLSMALVHGTDPHHGQKGYEWVKDPFQCRVDPLNDKHRDFTILPLWGTLNVKPGEGFFIRIYVVTGSLQHVSETAEKLVKFADYGKPVFDMEDTERIPLYAITADDGSHQTILTTDAPDSDASESDSESSVAMESIAGSYAIPVKGSFPLLLMKEVESGTYVLTTDPFCVCGKKKLVNPFKEKDRKYERYQNRVIYRPYDGRTEFLGLLGYVLPMPEDEKKNRKKTKLPEGHELLSNFLDKKGILFVPGEAKKASELMIWTGTDNSSNDDSDDCPKFEDDVIVGAASRVGEAYEDSIAGKAKCAGNDDHPEEHGSFVYTKVLGPKWLSVARDGSLSGIPSQPDSGLNIFAVRVSNDMGKTDVTMYKVDVESKVDVLIDSVSPGKRNWPLTKMAGPSPSAYSDITKGKVKYSIPTKNKKTGGGGLDILFNGSAQTWGDEPSKSFWFNDHNPNRILLDLGSSQRVREINTYAWHMARYNQAYDVYYAVDDKAPRCSSNVKDLVQAGWSRLGIVRVGDLGNNVQTGASLQPKWGDELVTTRYILFDMVSQYAFYGEIDIYVLEEEKIEASGFDLASNKVDVVFDSHSPGSKDWPLTQMEGPSSTSFSTLNRGKVKITVPTSNRPKRPVGQLLNGLAQRNKDDPKRSVWLDGDEPNRFLIDLGSIERVTNVNSFAWHVHRYRQFYNLYFSGEDVAPPSSSKVESGSLVDNGWVKVAEVKTPNPFETHEKNVQTGVSLRPADGGILMKARYILFDILDKSSFYGQIDVFTVPEVDIIFDSHSPGSEDWPFTEMEGPSTTAFSTVNKDQIKITVPTLNQSKRPTELLIDGLAQRNKDDPNRSVWLEGNAPNRFIMDLSSVQTVTQVNTFAWHVHRYRQFYNLYFSSSDIPPPSSSGVESTDLEGNGWVKIAEVATDDPFKTQKENVQTGVTVRPSDGGTLKARYILFDIFDSYTFYGEINVFVDDGECTAGSNEAEGSCSDSN